MIEIVIKKGGLRGEVKSDLMKLKFEQPENLEIWIEAYLIEKSNELLLI